MTSLSDIESGDAYGALGLPFDILFDDNGDPVTGDSEGAQLMRTVINDAHPPTPGMNVDEWLA